MKKIIGMAMIAGSFITLSLSNPLYARGPQGGGAGGGMGMGGSGTGSSNRGFVDADNNGINDRARDTNNDGIPDGQDPDYVRPQDGSGAGRGAVSGSGTGTPVLDGTGPHGAGKAAR
ncbi:hypothetical protein [Chlorobium sp. KB01]|uniref:hypothetical protein n=1 Tax=Chlorobium sp. KB01 TaxID=1917528 RepID=UPI000975DA29|nr:hypothetical protein [Chlorobium sp. KB01]